MENRQSLSRAKRLASITAVSAGAIALTSSKAEAASIIVSSMLNTTIGFTSAHPAGTHTVSDVFNSLVNGPSFTVKAISSNSAPRYARQIRIQGVLPFGFSGTTANAVFARIVPAGAVWDPVGNVPEGPGIAARYFGSRNSLFGDPPFTDEYLLFRFAPASTYEYGWIELSLSVTAANSSSPADGPTLTVIQYAFDTSGATIAAGDTRSAPATPEPSSIAESGLAALILGAEGLRRWRKARRAA